MMNKLLKINAKIVITIITILVIFIVFLFFNLKCEKIFTLFSIGKNYYTGMKHNSTYYLSNDMKYELDYFDYDKVYRKSFIDDNQFTDENGNLKTNTMIHYFGEAALYDEKNILLGYEMNCNEILYTDELGVVKTYYYNDNLNNTFVCNKYGEQCFDRGFVDVGWAKTYIDKNYNVKYFDEIKKINGHVYKFVGGIINENDEKGEYNEYPKQYVSKCIISNIDFSKRGFVDIKYDKFMHYNPNFNSPFYNVEYLDGKVFIKDNGSLACNEVVEINNKKYVFDEQQILVTNSLYFELERPYLLNDKGIVIERKGMYGFDKKTKKLGKYHKGMDIVYCVDDCGNVKVNEFFEYNNYYYFAKNDGSLLANEYIGKDFYFDKNMKLVKSGNIVNNFEYCKKEMFLLNLTKKNK